MTAVSTLTLSQCLCALFTLLGAGDRGFFVGSWRKGGKQRDGALWLTAGHPLRLVPTQLLTVLEDPLVHARIRAAVFDVPDVDMYTEPWDAESSSKRYTVTAERFRPIRLNVLTVRWSFSRSLTSRHPDRFEDTRATATRSLAQMAQSPTFVIDAETERIAGWALRTPIDVADEGEMNRVRMISIELARAAGADMPDVNLLLQADIPVPGSLVRRPFSNCRVEFLHFAGDAIYSLDQLQTKPIKQTAQRSRKDRTHVGVN